MMKVPSFFIYKCCRKVQTLSYVSFKVEELQLELQSAFFFVTNGKMF